MGLLIFVWGIYTELQKCMYQTKPCNIYYTNICNGIFHISFFKTLLINEGETTRGDTTTWQHCFGNMADDFPTELFLIFHNISNESNVSRIVYVESNIQ
jgi:hypothetical protein